MFQTWQPWLRRAAELWNPRCERPWARRNGQPFSPGLRAGTRGGRGQDGDSGRAVEGRGGRPSTARARRRTAWAPGFHGKADRAERSSEGRRVGVGPAEPRGLALLRAEGAEARRPSRLSGPGPRLTPRLRPRHRPRARRGSPSGAPGSCFARRPRGFVLGLERDLIASSGASRRLGLVMHEAGRVEEAGVEGERACPGSSPSRALGGWRGPAPQGGGRVGVRAARGSRWRTWDREHGAARPQALSGAGRTGRIEAPRGGRRPRLAEAPARTLAE